ncbi:hypothetical protein [Methanosphaera cuniculi]|uniref:hypothetical protein n=1 Tax=Methanosphaera cuniculi TaxID=1077256 RepID=UPI0026EEB489|nr:hypothetical protein [Methanosphaera cuniculi]
MTNKITKSFILLIMLVMMSSAIYAHGVDVTSDKMVIADESNGVEVKDIADANNMNISVYKFTSEDEVEHQLEHMINNTNKTILVTAYQSTAETFLKSHPEVENRLFIINDVNNQTIEDGLNKLNTVNVTTSQTENNSTFSIPLIAGIIIGLIIGIGCGVVIMKKKN